MVIITLRVVDVNTVGYGNAMDSKLDRQRWLSAGLQALANEGPEGLRIMPIAEQLGVTKGSFYWHFKNLGEYQAALLEEWEQCYTREPIDWIESDTSDPGAKLRTWIAGAAYADCRLDRAIRSWSLTDASVREVRSRVDQERINYLGKLLRNIGWSKEEAMTLGHWTYWAWVGYATLDGPVSTETQLKLILSVLTPK
jgi:AcrR family transcriptional regulator